MHYIGAGGLTVETINGVGPLFLNYERRGEVSTCADKDA